MKTLAIEAACPPGSIALAEAGTTRYFRQLDDMRRTTQSFAIVIQELLAEAAWEPADVEMVASTLGPGSFTGLRIAVTAAKVFAYTVAARAVGFNTLAVIARQAKTDGEVEAILNAQRGELFVARYQKRGEVIQEVQPTQIIDTDSWLKTRSASARLIGLGLETVIATRPSEKLVTEPEALWRPRADTVAQMAFEVADTKVELSPWQLTPNYFRRSAAEEKADQRRRGDQENTL